jgi:hypothetical protein
LSKNDLTKTGLAKFLEEKLAGSSLRIAPKSDLELEVQANEDIVLRIVEDRQKRILKFSLFSPKLDRKVTFEEIAGSTLLDVRLDEELKEKKDHEAEEADITLAIDLLGIWAKENKYSVSHSI